MQALRLSTRSQDLHSSPIREILSVIDRPGMISFAGGLPASETFPDVRLDQMPKSWLQYGPSEGEPVLRRRLALELQSIGIGCNAEQILILSGSQQGIDLVGKLFIDRNTRVALESPTYLAALQVFRFYGMSSMSLDPAKPDLMNLTSAARPAFVYVIPTFQNPTGRCWNATERDRLAAAADQHGVPVFEDDPYRDLVYDHCDRTPICARIKRAPWIYQGSFSKNFAPGLRLGFLAASSDLMPYLIRLKQAADLHSNRISQWLALEQLNDPGRSLRLARLANTYRLKRDHYQNALERHFGRLAHWEVPAGGLFFWLKLNQAIDTSELLSAAIAENVAFMPGEPFFAESNQTCPALRLNFSHASAVAADRGLATLARLVSKRYNRPN